MSHRHVGTLVLLLSLPIGGSGLAVAQAPPLPDTLEVLLTVAPSLPATARDTMRKEASAIWKREGVKLKWLPGTAHREPSPRLLRLLVLPKGRSSVSSENSTLVVAELVRPEKGHPVAIASIEIAERIVRDTTPTSDSDSTSAPRKLNPRLVGLVLGRAVAHEIGHFLLDSRTHAASGLMRARFDMREFVDPQSAAFLLDTEEALAIEGSRRDGRTTALTPLREAAGVSGSGDAAP